MPELIPEPGLVIPYAYLWRREHEAGEESGRKTRPCLVVIVMRREGAPTPRVAVAPITTGSPSVARAAVSIPARVKVHLGLDARPSWVLCDEYNAFDWPGVDRGLTPMGDPAFGFVPDVLTERVREEMRQARARGALKPTSRSS